MSLGVVLVAVWRLDSWSMAILPGIDAAIGGLF